MLSFPPLVSTRRVLALLLRLENHNRIAVIFSSCAGVSEMVDEWMRISNISGLATEQVAGARELDRAQTLARRLCSLLHLWASGHPAPMAPRQSGISLHDLMAMAQCTTKALAQRPSVTLFTSRLEAPALCNRRGMRLQLREETGVG